MQDSLPPATTTTATTTTATTSRRAESAEVRTSLPTTTHRKESSSSSSNPTTTAFSLATGTAHAADPVLAQHAHRVASMATTDSITASSSSAASADKVHVGLALEDTSSSASSGSSNNNVDQAEEWSSPCCSRGSKCLQLLDASVSNLDLLLVDNAGVAVCTPSPASAQKQHLEQPTAAKSCVDCGGCACCCCCFADEPLDDADDNGNTNMATKKSPSQRVYSIKLGRAQGRMLEEMFGQDAQQRQQQQRHLSSRALTVQGSESLMLGNSSNTNNSLVVRRLAFDEGDTSLHLQQHRDTTDNPHLSHNTTGSGCSSKWGNAINVIRIYTCRFLRWITHYAATYPKSCVGLVCFTSVAMLAIGLATNFHIEVENANLWPPQQSLSIDHTQWYYYDSNFNYDTSYFDMIIHAEGDNVLGQEGVRRTFEAIEAIQELEGYQEGCYWASVFGDQYYVGECKIHSVADFWNESSAIFEEQVASDYDAKVAMSAATYPNGIIVDEPRILGKAKHAAHYGADDDTYTQLESAQSYLVEFDLPWTNVTADFEMLALERIQQLQDEWDKDPNNLYKIEMAAYRSYSDEFFRAIIKDLPLLPCVFTIMAAFCCFVFWKRHRVQSRCLLGVGAVVCILLSILTGYGLLFIFGVPFTPVTTMMPFLMFGIGLDDAFILYGSYNRTDSRLDPVKRIEQTIDDVGLSISLTTLTSTIAFFMGVFSNIPAVSWVCWYAFPTIMIDFIYQITFFIALIVLDERRIEANRRDVCFWSVVPTDEELIEGATFSDSDESETPNSRVTYAGSPTASPTGSPNSVDTKDNEEKMQPVPKSNTAVQKKDSFQDTDHFADRFMNWFAKQLLKGKVQGFVVTLFLVIFGGMLYCATQLTQQFDYIDMVPKDSYLRDYFGALDDHTIRSGLNVYVFFRDIDQSDPAVQDQMDAYIDDLTESSAIAHQPVYFWLRDFKEYIAYNNATLGSMTFNEQVGEFFKDPGWDDLYGEHVARSKEDGSVLESRCVAYVDVDMRDSKAGTSMLSLMREVSSRQPVNQGRDDWAFLTYADEYHLLEFYAVVVRELIFTTFTGVIVVSVIGLIFIPHWTAVLFVFPFITFLYIDMLGFLQISGVQINAISYITLVMSIGLMVDFIMHILLRYYECKGSREQRVVETLSTMGASILVGAISTFLGVMLLVFSTSSMINNIFISFIGLVTFGVLHGLVFLPTLLAMVGPEC